MKKSWLIGTLSLSALAALAAPKAGDGGVKSDLAVRAIVGEAAGQPYAVKLGVAAAIRNRGHLRGVYGVNARHNASEPAWVWTDAKRAWQESAKRCPIGNADHFGNADDVRKGTFQGMKLIAVIGTGKAATYFFKAVDGRRGHRHG